jgi:hypothetical protein
LKVVNALLKGKQPPKWRGDADIEEAVTAAEQQKSADMAAYFADHPQATIEDFKAAIEENEQARLNAEELEQARRSAALWDEREAAKKAGLPWSPPSGHEDIGWIRDLVAETMPAAPDTPPVIAETGSPAGGAPNTLPRSAPATSEQPSPKLSSERARSPSRSRRVVPLSAAAVKAIADRAERAPIEQRNPTERER